MSPGRHGGSAPRRSAGGGTAETRWSSERLDVITSPATAAVALRFLSMGLLTPLAVRVGRLEFMPKLLPQITAIDKRLDKVTRGRLTLLDIAGLPNLRLTVIGRKSGQPRTTPLLAVPRGRDWLIAGSNFGGPKQPVWVVNLEANPECWIEVKGRRHEVRSRRLEGEERQRAWDHMVETWPNYTKYEQRTERQIKVFELTPR